MNEKEIGNEETIKKVIPFASCVKEISNYKCIEKQKTTENEFSVVPIYYLLSRIFTLTDFLPQSTA
jgi:hypothetical protein